MPNWKTIRAAAVEGEEGFTLVELMVVIVIIGLLATIVAINVIPATETARVEKAKADISTIEQALEQYRLDNLTYPAASDGLQALISPPASLAQPQRYRRGGYIKKLPEDPWGRAFSTPCRGGKARSTSVRWARTGSRAGRMRMRTSSPASFDPSEAGFTSLKRSAEHGFTLLELMVVLTIIGFISAAVVLAIPDPRGRVVEDADRFAARVAAARDEAVVTARPMGVWVSASGYGFQRREGGGWASIDQKPFGNANWKAGTRALVGKDGGQQIAFDGTGLPTDPLTVTLAREGERVAVTVDMAGKVMVGG